MANNERHFRVITTEKGKIPSWNTFMWYRGRLCKEKSAEYAAELCTKHLNGVFDELPAERANQLAAVISLIVEITQSNMESMLKEYHEWLSEQLKKN